VSFILKLIPAGKKARIVLAIVLLLGISWVVHFVYNLFQTTNSVAVSPVAVGLALNSPDDQEAFTALNLTSMQPGADEYVGMTVANTGTADFWFNMASTPSGDSSLGKDLLVGIAAVPAGNCSSSGYAAGTFLHRDSRGLVNASIGWQPLAAGDSEYLCFHVRLPAALPESVQGGSAQDTLNFTARS
jgi:hypothetical protein